MRLLGGVSLALFIGAGLSFSQSTFQITGTAIPPQLLNENYGKLPAGIAGFDLNVCNIGATKQAVVQSEIFQALAQTYPGLQPIGREILLAAILRTQNRNAASITSMVLSSATSVLSILSSARYSVPPGVVSGAALGTMTAQQVLSGLKPVLSADMLANFERQVLESAIVLDSGSCVERTIFATVSAPAQKSKPLSFHVR